MKSCQGSGLPKSKKRGRDCIQCSADRQRVQEGARVMCAKRERRRGGKKNPSQRPVARWIRSQKGVRETAHVSVRPRAWPLARIEGDVFFTAVLPSTSHFSCWVKPLPGSLSFGPSWAASFLPSAVSVLRRAIDCRNALRKSVTGVAALRDGRHTKRRGAWLGPA